MRVLLVYSAPDRDYWPVGVFRSHWVPTGLAYLATAMRRAGHDVRVHVRAEHLVKNGFDWQDADERTRGLLAEFRPELVGFSVLSPGVRDTATMSRWVKRMLGDHVLTVAGGAHPTALPERMLADCPDVDVVVIGEAEETLVELADRGPQADVAGLVYRDGQDLVATGRRANPSDLDGLGQPAYDLFDMSYYTHPNSWMIRWLYLKVTNIRTSRGCPNRCRFCAGHVVAGLGVRYHSVDYVIDQMRNAVDQFGVNAIHFEDDTIGSDRQRLLDLCEAIRCEGLHEKIKWDCSLRVDQAEAELLKQMKRAGCIQVEYGFECGSDAALRRVGKNTTTDMNRRAVALTHQAGLRIYADIMLGLPGETEEEVEATRRFLQWARPEVISCARLTPLPGTAIFEQLPPEAKDRISWGEYAYLSRPAPKFNLTAMSDERFEEVFRRFHKYVVSPHVKRTFLRDMPPGHHRVRWKFRRELAKFVLRHPIRAMRVPW